ncbi:unnamed protein product [Periconia digitata]|uniref:Uncharacterized protein n=1 Tax=Periconia digitata TaxID=1303443 RepID=A0A9W4UL14_9PLEO|nr:unnamed protein product [Periconia digitata]
MQHTTHHNNSLPLPTSHCPHPSHLTTTPTPSQSVRKGKPPQTTPFYQSIQPQNPREKHYYKPYPPTPHQTPRTHKKTKQNPATPLREREKHYRGKATRQNQSSEICLVSNIDFYFPPYPSSFIFCFLFCVKVTSFVVEIRLAPCYQRETVLCISLTLPCTCDTCYSITLIYVMYVPRFVHTSN